MGKMTGKSYGPTEMIIRGASLVHGLRGLPAGEATPSRQANRAYCREYWWPASAAAGFADKIYSSKVN